MHRDFLQQEIIGCIWSASLRRRLKETGRVFTPDELMTLAWKHAPDFEDRLSLLRRVAEVFPEKAAHVQRLEDWQRRSWDAFCSADLHAIYELHIRETPDAYDERYLCADWAAVLHTIDGFWREYEQAEPSTVRYTIVKRLVLERGAPFQEDELGQCLLGPGKRLLRVEMFDGFESGPDRDMPRVDFPVFLPDWSLVQYRQEHSGRLHLGLLLADDGQEGESVTLIPLDAQILWVRDAQEVWWQHCHIDAEQVTLAEEQMQPEWLRAGAADFIAWVRTQRLLGAEQSSE
ncbi:MAG: hypothetical protein IJZ74_10295 [Clostridia bacterium]|nr:hypothetical protein [Clostridia bacterium]